MWSVQANMIAGKPNVDPARTGQKMEASEDMIGKLNLSTARQYYLGFQLSCPQQTASSVTTPRCIHEYIHEYIHAYMYVCIHTHTQHTYRYTHMQAYTQACIHPFFYTYLHTYIHSQSHTSRQRRERDGERALSPVPLSAAYFHSVYVSVVTEGGCLCAHSCACRIVFVQASVCAPLDLAFIPSLFFCFRTLHSVSC